MSTLGDIIAQVNSLTGYHIPSASGYIISSSTPIGSGSVNNIVNQINSLTGYNIPAVSASFTSGSIVGQPLIVYAQTPASGTIPTTGIYPGGIIKAQQILNIINAFNGISAYDIIISGSFTLPQVPNENLLESISGTIEGTDVVNGGSY